MPATGQPIRYAIYTRQSVERPADFSSCDAQFANCQSFAARAGSENAIWIGQRFDDEGESGGSLERPALTRLRGLVRARAVERIYVTALDRLARRVYDLITLLEEFECAGVAVQLAQEFNPPDGPQAKLIRHLLGVFAEFERDMTATRIVETRVYLKQHGRRIAGPAPFGYAADPTTKQLVSIPKEARRVRLIFHRAAAGQTPSDIAFRINHMKWRTKTWMANRSGKQRGGGKWTARMVLQLLRNPIYLGQHREGKGSRPGCHEAVVKNDLFVRVQKVLDGRRTVSNPKRQPQSFPLRGKIICPKCRRPLSSQMSSTPRGGTTRIHHRYYCCRSHAGGRAPCTGARYPAFEIEEFVRNVLGDESQWRQFLPDDRAGDACALASTWTALGRRIQDDLLPDLVDTIHFGRKNTEIEITFNPRLADAIKRQKSGI